MIKGDDRLTLPVFQPEISRDGCVMLIGFPVPVDPSVELTLADRKPFHEPLGWNVGLLGPDPGEINDGVSRIMGNPDAS